MADTGRKLARSTSTYHYYVQRPLEEFWLEYGTQERKVLFVYGLGFDPRCIPALRKTCRIFHESAELVTFCARFTNLFDEHLAENQKNTQECLEQIRYVTRSLIMPRHKHYEVEVNLFGLDREQIGDSLLISEFDDCLGAQMGSFTDVIVDVSAFPRSLMYTLIGHLWESRLPNQNLFAVLTETARPVKIVERDFVSPSYLRGDRHVEKIGPQIWVPVLGGELSRFEAIYEFIKPEDVFPIIPFPSSNPRRGDDILLSARETLFARWGVPIDNVLYASGAVPWDVFRKIADFVESQTTIRDDVSVVVSALSGRSLSLGVLMAALWCDLYMCHAQPTTYAISHRERNKLKNDCESATPTLYWLAGELYDESDGTDVPDF